MMLILQEQHDHALTENEDAGVGVDTARQQMDQTNYLQSSSRNYEKKSKKVGFLESVWSLEACRDVQSCPFGVGTAPD